MNKLKGSVLALLLVSLAAMIGIHWFQIQDSSKKIQILRNLTERQTIANNLILEMEKYRRQSSSFRKLGDGESSSAKQRLRGEFSVKLAQLDKLSLPDGNGEDKGALSAHVADQLAEFLLLSARIEPTLYTRDFYQRPEGRQLHEGIVDALNQISEQAKGKEADLLSRGASVTDNSTHWLLGLAGGAALLVVFLLLGNYFASIRPSRRLKLVADKYRRHIDHPGEANAAESAPVERLSGIYGEIERALKDLAGTVHVQRLERHRFVVAIATELRAPLMSIKTWLDLFDAEKNREHACEMIRQEGMRLGRALDDLTDLIETEQTHLKLNEKILDFQSFVQGLATWLGAQNSKHQIVVSGPHVPIWTHVDSQRVERVLLHVLTKAMTYAPEGGEIRVNLNMQASGSFRGLEVQIKEVAAGTSGPLQASGPEQDILRHWVSEAGYGMVLAQRIMQAHGGSLSVAGVAGTSVLFVLRFPAERIVSGSPRAVRPTMPRFVMEGIGLGF